MKKAIQKIHDICSGHKYCQDCPLLDPDADALDETCIITSDEACIIMSPPDTWDVDKISDILERLS